MVSSSQLQMAIDALHNGANTYAQAAGELRALSNRITSKALELASGADQWTGQGAEAFQTACQQYQSDIQRAMTAFETVTPVLNTLARALEEALWTKTEVERLDPLNALLRLGRSIPYGFGTEAAAIEHAIVESDLQVFLEETIMAADAIAAGALDSIVLADIAQQSVSPQFAALQKGAEALGSLLGDVDAIVEPIAKVAGHELPPEVGWILTPYEIATDYYSGKTHDFRTLGSDIIGGLVGLGVGLTGVGAIIEGVAAGVHLLSQGAAFGQNMYASQFSGNLRIELQDPANNLNIVAGNADIGKVFDDVGKLVIDSDGTIGNPVEMLGIIGGSYLLRHFGINVPGEVDPTVLASDYEGLFVDTGKLVLSPVQLVVNTEAANIDDTLVGIDKSLQNLPVPGPIKTNIDTFTPIAIKDINGIADFVTKPQGIEKVGSEVWSWITK